MNNEARKRVLIATDAWYPQVNGVVRTLDNTCYNLRELGHEIHILSHDGKRTWGLPSYPEIQLAFYSQKEIHAIVESFTPDCIHIATEGPTGLAMRKYCIRQGLDFTTGFHTQFAEYVSVRLPFPGVLKAAYAWLRWFHKPSQAVLTPTRTVTENLARRGFTNTVTWTRGVDHETFQDYRTDDTEAYPSPVMVYVGRLAIEKGIDDFMQTGCAGTKLIIGDGPARTRLEKRYPDAVFTGYLFGEELARKISSGDVFVFPSKTDTFGLVMLEAMACGLPVAAYPVTGPIDVVEHGYSGWLDDNLETAITKALELSRKNAVEYAGRFTWKNTATMLLEHLCETKR